MRKAREPPADEQKPGAHGDEVEDARAAIAAAEGET